MTDKPDNKSQKDKAREAREERLNKALRDNLRRRKAAMKKPKSSD